MCPPTLIPMYAEVPVPCIVRAARETSAAYCPRDHSPAYKPSHKPARCFVALLCWSRRAVCSRFCWTTNRPRFCCWGAWCCGRTTSQRWRDTANWQRARQDLIYGHLNEEINEIKYLVLRSIFLYYYFEVLIVRISKCHRNCHGLSG